jgi:hypothetical protein
MLISFSNIRGGSLVVWCTVSYRVYRLKVFCAEIFSLIYKRNRMHQPRIKIITLLLNHKSLRIKIALCFCRSLAYSGNGQTCSNCFTLWLRKLKHFNASISRYPLINLTFVRERHASCFTLPPVSCAVVVVRLIWMSVLCYFLAVVVVVRLIWMSVLCYFLAVVVRLIWMSVLCYFLAVVVVRLIWMSVLCYFLAVVVIWFVMF